MLELKTHLKDSSNDGKSFSFGHRMQSKLWLKSTCQANFIGTTLLGFCTKNTKLGLANSFPLVSSVIGLGRPQESGASMLKQSCFAYVFFLWLFRRRPLRATARKWRCSHGQACMDVAHRGKLHQHACGIQLVKTSVHNSWRLAPCSQDSYHSILSTIPERTTQELKHIRKRAM